MSKAEKTREFIIEKAAPIFNKKGYENTSLSDILAVTKLTKGSIYGNFSDKNELALAAYQFNATYIFSKVSEAIKSKSSSTEAIIAYGDFYFLKWDTVFKVGGCPMLNAAVEADDHLHYLTNHVRNSFQKFLDLLHYTIEQGIRNNEFKAELNARDYAALIHSIV